MRVSVAGTGYVGLVSGVCLADVGHQVTCVDMDAKKVDMINAGKSPIYENGLDELLTQHIGKNVRATQDLHNA
ncbi:MAG: UDP-glucose/GDP-mannose dehydrogenase family protein, partial [Pseudomonadota bacterium]